MMKMGLKHFLFFLSLSKLFKCFKTNSPASAQPWVYDRNQLLATLKESAGMQRISNQRKR